MESEDYCIKISCPIGSQEIHFTRDFVKDLFLTNEDIQDYVLKKIIEVFNNLEKMA